MVKITEFNTGDRFKDYNLADKYINEYGGEIIGFPDCVIVVIED
jgi:hypothetical protein